VLEVLNKHQESLPLDRQTIHRENDLTETNKPQSENNTESQDASKPRVDNEIESGVVLDISMGPKLKFEDGCSKIGAEAGQKSENDTKHGLKRSCDSEIDFPPKKQTRQIPDELTPDKQISVGQIPHDEISAEQPATDKISTKISSEISTKKTSVKTQKSNPEKTSFHCLVCSKVFETQKEYRLHYNSTQHKNIIDGYRRPETGKPHGLRPVYHCATCCLDFQNPSSLVRHFNKKCHRDVFFGVAVRKNENSGSACLGVRKPPEPRKLVIDNVGGAGHVNELSGTPLSNNGKIGKCAVTQIVTETDTKTDMINTRQTSFPEPLIMELENAQRENSENDNSCKKIQIHAAFSDEDLRQHVLSRQFHTPTISESGSHNFSSDPVEFRDTLLTITQHLVRQPHTSTPNHSLQAPVSHETIHANQLLTNLALMQLLNPQLKNDSTFGQHLQNLNFQSAQQVQQTLLIQQLQSAQNIQKLKDIQNNNVQRQLNLGHNQPHSSFQQTVNSLARNPKSSKFPETTIDKTDEIP